MNREILFRGKRLDNREWVYGYLFVNEINGDAMILNGWESPVDTEVNLSTVGQYTGLTDKNGVKIFEGDIVKTTRYGKYINFWVVSFDCGTFEFRDREQIMNCETFNYDYLDFSSVVGNVHDNPK